MVVESTVAKSKNEMGQSILEVLFILPFLFTFVALLFKTNMAAQVAINNTQFSRSQIFVLTANSPEYPRIDFRFNSPLYFAQKGEDEMILGVADPTGLGQSAGDTIIPIPETTAIGRQGTSVPGSSASGEVSTRTTLRARNTAAICTQTNSPDPTKKTAMWPDEVSALQSSRWPFGQEVCQYTGKGSG